MLDRMRESSKSGLTMIVFAIIMVVFAISFGAPMDGCQAKSGPQYVATAAGHDIETDELGIMYNRWGGSRDRDTDENQQLTDRAKALKALILIHLMAEEGRKLGLYVGEAEFKDYILNPLRNAEFQQLYGRSGKLNKTYYKNYVENQLRVSLKQYEEFKTTELMARKYMELVEMQLAATPAEVEALDTLRNTRLTLDYIKLSAQSIKDNIQLTDAEIDAFIQANADKIKAAYDKDKDAKYSDPAKYQLRRLYVSVPTDADDAKKKELREKFDAAVARLKTEDFAKVAKEVGDDYFGKNTEGLMEWVPKEYLPQEISGEIEKLKAGESKEASTPSANIYYKLEGVQEAKVTPMEEVQKDIARQLMLDGKVEETLKSMTARLEERAKSAPSLTEALAQIKAELAPAPTEPAQPVKEGEPAPEVPAAPKSPWDAISVQTTPPFNLEGSGGAMAMFGGRPWDLIPGIGKSAELATDAFKLTKKEPLGKKVYKVGEDQVFVQLKERLEPGQQPKPAIEPKPEDAKEENKEDDAKAKAEARQKDQLRIIAEIRSDRSNALIKNWQSLFLVPSDDLGPWLENMYQDAIKSKRVSFSQRDKTALALKNKLEPILPTDGAQKIELKTSDGKPANIKLETTPAKKAQEAPKTP